MVKAKRAVSAAIVAVSLVLIASTAVAFRCGNDLVSVGDHSFEVLQNCGEPLYREVIGYTITPEKKRDLIIEEWIYGPRHGHYYLLRFEGNRLAAITSIKE